jgi:hypothetical protein
MPCKAQLDRVTARMKQTIFWYYWLTASVGTVAVVMMVLVNMPGVPLALTADKIQGNLITALFGALSLPSFNEIQKRRDRILRLLLVKEEYDSVSVLSGQTALAELERRCHQAVDEVLKG